VISHCLSVTFVSPVKMAEPIEMMFGGWDRLAQGTIISWGCRSPTGRSNFSGLSGPLKTIGSLYYSVHKKTVEPIWADSWGDKTDDAAFPQNSLTICYC